jgi:hypothetical protein
LTLLTFELTRESFGFPTDALCVIPEKTRDDQRRDDQLGRVTLVTLPEGDTVQTFQDYGPTCNTAIPVQLGESTGRSPIHRELSILSAPL